MIIIYIYYNNIYIEGDTEYLTRLLRLIPKLENAPQRSERSSFFKILKRSSSSLDELFNTRKIIYNDLISQIVEHFW